MLTSAAWFVTWACQNRCPYCWQRDYQAQGRCLPGPFIEYRRWTEAWNRLAQCNGEQGFVLDIAGGEVFLQPDFVPMLQALDDRIALAITTNLMESIEEFVDKITPWQVIHMTLSFHPTEMPLEVFLGKALLLQRKGFKVIANLVACPEFVYVVPRITGILASEGLEWHVEPYMKPINEFYAYDEEQIKLLSAFVKGNRSVRREVPRPVMCDAGTNRIVVLPDGDAYRCVLDALAGQGIMGNILSQAGVPFRQSKGLCANYGACIGCDKDKVQVEDVTPPSYPWVESG